MTANDKEERERGGVEKREKRVGSQRCALSCGI
jgi:hypothetical protein